MIFSEDRLYGWGASNIAMPRVTVERHSTGPRGRGEVRYHDGQAGVAYRWYSSSVFRIFVDDSPWSQALVLGTLFTVFFALIYLTNRTLSRDQDVPLTRPVEIVVALNEEKPQKTLPLLETKSLESSEPEKIEPVVTTETVTEEPDKVAIAQPKEVKQQVYKEKPKKAPESQPSHFGVKQRLPRQRRQKPQKLASVTPLIKSRTKTEKITILPPALQQRKYSGKDATRISQPHQAIDRTDFVSKKKNKSAEDIVDAGRLQRRYKTKLQNNISTKFSQLETTNDIFASDQADEKAKLTLSETLLADRRYNSKAQSLAQPAQKAPLNASKRISIQHQRRGEVLKLVPKKRARSFSKKSHSSSKAPERTGRTISFPASRQQTEFSGTTSPVNRQSNKRYAIEKNTQYRFRAPQKTKQEIFFKPQKREKKPNLVLPVAAKPLAKKTRTAKKGSSYLVKAPSFSETIIPDEIDPSELTSLKEFNVCKDPQKEFRHKTQLAVHLHKPSRFKAGGVLFFIKYTESGYTIEVDVYNPQGRPFKDRCEVLELAIDSIVNRIN